MLLSILEQGLIFSIMAQGVYITYRILDFPDMSVDGTFVLGAAIASLLISKGANPYLATLIAIFGGMAGGSLTAILHIKFNISNILSGILVMLGIYSINLRIMGKPNIPLFNKTTIFTEAFPKIIIIFLIAIITKILFDIFIKTKLGFLLKATGDNHQLVTSLGFNISTTKLIGLMLSNGFVALSGAIMSQYQGFSDVTMGTGTIIIGLASIIIGESIFKTFSLFKPTTLVILGAVLYRGVIALVLTLGLPPTDLKLITSIIVIVILATHNSSNKLSLRSFRLKNKRRVSVASNQ
ncbi:ABC transporter permease [Clostridium manihotivorum]|uniref:ABC transporter permease n=1 Tax=Clostridium manihotivorum TaxID=2320868 RepID=A0A410E1K3_9CLOT|nr:ABC transporter permease [Clostridium manihotivorum]QAA35163.1 ABC transporter permease [Clostridium manihotivorum]